MSKIKRPNPVITGQQPIFDHKATGDAASGYAKAHGVLPVDIAKRMKIGAPYLSRLISGLKPWSTERFAEFLDAVDAIVKERTQAA